MKIAILEDNQFVLQNLTKALEHLDYEPHGFQSPEAFQAYLIENPDTVLMIVDQMIQSPESGWNVACQLRDQLDRQIPIVVVTGYSNQELEATISETAKAVLVKKPFSLNEIGKTVQHVLAIQS